MKCIHFTILTISSRYALKHNRSSLWSSRNCECYDRYYISTASVSDTDTAAASAALVSHFIIIHDWLWSTTSSTSSSPTFNRNKPPHRSKNIRASRLLCSHRWCWLLLLLIVAIICMFCFHQSTLVDINFKLFGSPLNIPTLIVAIHFTHFTSLDTAWISLLWQGHLPTKRW